MIYPVIDKIALFGPYVGDWKEEILSFRPFVKWVYNNLEFTDYYISTHFNRGVLYDFMDSDKFIPVFETLTRDEKKQKNATHRDIKTKEYNSIIVRKTREEIAKNTGYLKKNILQYSLNYVKTRPNFSILNKDFSRIPYNEDEEKEKIVFIPARTGNKKLLEKILLFLDKNYRDDYVVIGDKKCYFKDNNVIYRRVDYFEIVYQLIIDYISNAKLVICPCGHWTVLANQQNTYVVSWGGENIAQYKTDGIHGFGNRNSIVDIQQDLIEEKLIKHIDSNIKNIYKGAKLC